jgi:hypothetical protein
MSGSNQADDRSIVLEAIDSMLELAVLTPDMRSELRLLRRRVETFRSASEASDED